MAKVVSYGLYEVLEDDQGKTIVRFQSRSVNGDIYEGTLNDGDPLLTAIKQASKAGGPIKLSQKKTFDITNP